ncbi:hypothetical protein KAI46_15465, partial [bacterium]|nr:hypothetical protein [bacterium]
RIKKSGSRKTYLDSFWNPNLKNSGYGFTTKTGELHVRKYDVRSDAKTKRTYIPSRLPLTVRRVITVASMFEQSPTFIPVQKIAGETWQHEFLRQLTL